MRNHSDRIPQRLAAFVAACALTLTLCASALSVSYPFTAVTTDSVNMRRSASSSATILEKLSADAEVTVLGASGNYYKVTYGSRTGYIMKSYLTAKTADTTASAETATGYPYETTTNAKVHLRSKRSTSSTIVTTIPSGKTVTVSGVSGTFAEVTYGSYKGYVKTSRPS